MPIFLFYDTETTGLPLWKEPSEHPDQPHLTQIAALLTDETGAKLGLLDLLVRPDGWTIPEELQKLTGITMERAETGGVGEDVAVAMFIAMWRRATVRVAHNESFDARILRIALHRYPHVCDADEWKAGSHACTQALSTPILKLPPTERMVAAGFDKPKPPKLEEAYRHFLKREMKGAHDALADVRACREVFFAIRDMEIA
jgi:DNA polymerase-3 subunit epsilon